MKPSDLIRLLSLSAIWGASFLFVRIGAPVLGPLPTAFFRVLIGAVTLAACLVLMKVKWDMRGKWRPVIALGVINSGHPVRDVFGGCAMGSRPAIRPFSTP